MNALRRAARVRSSSSGRFQRRLSRHAPRSLPLRLRRRRNRSPIRPRHSRRLRFRVSGARAGSLLSRSVTGVDEVIGAFLWREAAGECANFTPSGLKAHLFRGSLQGRDAGGMAARFLR